jgi:hypothetical protein
MGEASRRSPPGRWRASPTKRPVPFENPPPLDMPGQATPRPTSSRGAEPCLALPSIRFADDPARIHPQMETGGADRARGRANAFQQPLRLGRSRRPVAADPTGESFTFEKGVTKTGGGEGFADVWKKDFFAWEYKKRKRNLDEALVQLVRYAAALENPPLQVVCDTDRFLIRTAWTREVPKTYEFALEDLADPTNLSILHSVFFDPDKLRPKETRAGVTKEAADKFSTIASRLQGRGSPAEVAHFVNQLVFCFFAHSVKLLPDRFLPRLLKRCSEGPQDAKRYFDGLFAAMEKGGDFDLTRIAHFNGGLFVGRRPTGAPARLGRC